MIADLLNVNKVAYQFFSANSAAVSTYLESRGMKPGFSSELAPLQFGYAPRGNALCQYLTKLGDSSLIDHALSVGLIKKNDEGQLYDFFRDRLIIPILSNGDIIGFGGRVINSDNPGAKYLNSQESELFDKSGVLFTAGDSCASYPSTLIVEGYMDAIALSQHDFFAVAGMGTSLTSRQLSVALNTGRPVVLLFDGDKAGQKAARRAAITALTEISESRVVNVCLLYDGYDPDEYIREFGPDALSTHIELNSVDVVDFVVHNECEDIDQFVNHYAQLLGIIKDAKNPYAANAIARKMGNLPAEMVNEITKSSGVSQVMRPR